jgi:hypothetical protein
MPAAANSQQDRVTLGGRLADQLNGFMAQAA